jgi:hypothetical protein
MKKTFFLKGVAALVLAGCMFTSCEKEDLNATFKPGPAEVTLNVEVIDALSKLDKTNEATITVSNAEFKVNTPSVFPLGVSAQTITVTATLNNGTASSEVEINKTKVGGEAEYYVKLVIADGLEIVTEKGSSSSETIYASNFNHGHIGHDANHSHDGITGWFTNATDYLIPFKFDYQVIKNKYTNVSDITYSSWSSNLDQVQKDGIIAAHSAIKDATPEVETQTLEGKISAWAYFTMYATYTTTDYTCTAKTINSNDVAATFTYKAANSTVAEYTEIAHPSHAGHYQHGHGHSGASNAGGGIVLPE